MDIAEFVARLAHSAGCVDFEVFVENFQGKRVDFPLRRFAPTVGLEAIATH